MGRLLLKKKESPAYQGLSWHPGLEPNATSSVGIIAAAL